MADEIELKFVGPEEALQRIRKSAYLRKLARGRRFATKNLHAVYYDTPDFALRAQGLVLRVRQDGERFVQTVKSSHARDIASRVELNGEVPGFEVVPKAIEDRKVRRAVLALKKKLTPVFSVEVQRSALRVRPRKGAEVELAIDTGVIKPLTGKDKARAAISELEVELVKGNAQDLIGVARGVTDGLPLTFAAQSKAERGYALAAGEGDRAVVAAPVVLDRKAPPGDAFGRIITRCVTQLLGNIGAVVRAREPEGIHQMRIAMRRLRSALSLFGEPYRGSMKTLAEEIKWLTGVLGGARDLDVFHDAILQPAVEAHGEDERLTKLATIVRARRRAAWEAALEAIESDRFRKLALELAAVTLTRPWTLAEDELPKRVTAFAQERLAKRRRKAQKLGRQLDELDAAGRHEFRKRLKKLRYASEFFSSLFGAKATRRYQMKLKELQDLLGHLNDAAVARALVADVLANEGGRDPALASALAYAGGVVVGWHTAEGGITRARLAKKWRKFEKIRAFWD